jgi:hypothetical protein
MSEVTKTHLQAWSGGELFASEQLGELVPGRNFVTLVSALAAKRNREALDIPGLDVVVAFIPSVDEPLDGITLVADDEAFSMSALFG